MVDKNITCEWPRHFLARLLVTKRKYHSKSPVSGRRSPTSRLAVDYQDEAIWDPAGCRLACGPAELAAVVVLGTSVAAGALVVTVLAG